MKREWEYLVWQNILYQNPIPPSYLRIAKRGGNEGLMKSIYRKISMELRGGPTVVYHSVLLPCNTAQDERDTV